MAITLLKLNPVFKLVLTPPFPGPSWNPANIKLYPLYGAYSAQSLEGGVSFPLALNLLGMLQFEWHSTSSRHVQKNKLKTVKNKISLR